MLEDRPLQIAQRRPRLEAELVHHGPARVVVGRERLGLASGTVEREHQLGSESLAERVLAHQRTQLRHQLGGRAALQLGRDQLLAGLDPQLLQPCDGLARERLVLEARERPAAPQREPRPQCLRRALGPVRRELLAPGVEGSLEPVEVQLSGLDAQGVAARSGCEPAAVVAERLSQP